MNILHSARNALVPVHRAGYPFIALFLVIAVILGFLWQPLFWAGLVLTLWCAYFFRDPKRLVPEAGNIAVSPADGKVSFVGLAVPPADLGLGSAELLRISVFMDIFSCHINRAPMRGRISGIIYRKGKFFNAELDKASEANEANALLIETAHGAIGVVQIAGLVARRIVCFARKGDRAEAGQRFGLIRFGSRLDIYLPPQAQPCVGVGQSMIAGETVLAVFAENKKNAGQDGAAEAVQAEKNAVPLASAVSRFRLD